MSESNAAVAAAAIELGDDEAEALERAVA